MITELHAKSKGALGELAVAKDLIRLGYSVFSELGDNSKVDLIALVPAPIRIQVKAFNSNKSVINLPCKKSGPNYRFRYTEEDVDIFAVYILDHDKIFYVSSRELLTNRTGMNFRLDATLNNQVAKTRFVDDYLDFRKALRDYTGNTLTDNAEGNEIVQTTTAKVLVKET